MAETTTHNHFHGRWRALWHGRDGFRAGLAKLLWAFVRLWLGRWLWGTAVRLAHFPVPTKYVGAAVALLATLLVFWAVWGLGQALLLMGARRLGSLLLIAFALVVGFNVLTMPDERPFPVRVWVQIGNTAQAAENWLGQLAQSAVKAPDAFQFAYTGQRNPPALPPGFPTPDPEATLVRAVVVAAGGVRPTVAIPTPVATAIVTEESPQAPPPTSSSISTPAPKDGNSLIVGGYAIVVNTGGQALRARAVPGTNADITARFEEGTRLQLLAGPKTVEEFVWWQVRSEDGQEGWCADRWLSYSD